MQNEEICREVIETLLHIKVGKLEYKSFEKDSKLEPDKPKKPRFQIWESGFFIKNELVINGRNDDFQ